MSSQTDLARYTSACDYNTTDLDEIAVEAYLRAYLTALGVTRQVVRLRVGWTLAEYPALAAYVDAVLARLPRAARAARDARDARDALDARVARDARDALDARRFAAWCIQGNTMWWWRWDLAWVVTTFFGAVQLRLPLVERWSRPLFEAFVAGAWIIHWTDDTLYWVSKPKVHIDVDVRRLHCETGPALESDIEPLYFWHGVLVPDIVVMHPDQITVQHIRHEPNAEVRRVMIERYGWPRWLADQGARPVQSDHCGDLYHVDMDGARIGVVVVRNSTPEPDGRVKSYALLVSPEHETAHSAVASTFKMTAAQYQPVQET